MPDYSPPPVDVRDQIFAAEIDAYEKQGRMLRYSLYTNAILVAGIVGSLTVAGWAITKERDHIRLVGRDELGIYHVLNVTPKAMNSGERLVVADRWIRDVMDVTTDMTANRNMRNVAVSRLNLPGDEKQRVLERAHADLKKEFGFAVSVGRIEFKPKGDTGMAYDATFNVERVDMRGMPSPEPRRLERYVADVQFVETTPTLAIPDGLLIAPFEPRKIEDVK